MPIKRTLSVAAAATIVGVAMLVGQVASATTPNGNTFPGILAGSGSGPIHVKQDGVELKTHSDTTIRQYELVYAPNEVADWHSHPGLVIATVKSGSVTRFTGCGPGDLFTANPDDPSTPTNVEKGSSFTEVGPHKVVAGPEGATLLITRIYPSADERPRIAESAPICK
jgi:hypothetical protein